MVDLALTAIRVLDSIALLSVLGLMAITWVRRGDRENELLFGMLVGIGAWIAGDLVVKLRVVPDLAEVFVDVQLTASAVAVTFMFLFVAEYTGRPEVRTRAAPLLLAVEPLVVTALIWTNGAHGLVYDPASMLGSRVAPAMGPALIVHALYSYFLVLLGVAFLVDFVERTHESYRRQAYAIGVGAVVPLAGNVIYLFGAFPYDLTPVSYAVTGALLTYAVVRADLLRLTPVARGTVLETTPVSVFVLGPDGSILDANPKARRLVAAAEETLLGRHALELFEDYPELADRLAELLPADRRREFAVEGGDYAFDVRVSPLSDRGGRARGNVVVVDDVTERTEYERRLEERTERLEVLNRVVRHDIRNDMTLVLGYVDALEDHVDETGSQYLDATHEAGEHVVELTRNVRELMETMLEDTDPKPVALAPILRTEIDDLAESNDRATVRVDGSIPRVRVRADEMLRSVFRNLLKNAVQHNDTSTPEIDVSVEDADGRVVVSVADNGPGISDDRKAEIFGKGEMGLESEGTGVGLYLVATLVESYGGEVRVRDNDPRGAVFEVVLERVDAESGGGADRRDGWSDREPPERNCPR